MYCRDSLVSVVPTHILGGNDVVEEIPFDDTSQDMVALYGFESIIKVLKCHGLLSESERYSELLDGRKLPEGT